jgi:hypothetical protein
VRTDIYIPCLSARVALLWQVLVILWLSPPFVQVSNSHIWRAPQLLSASFQCRFLFDVLGGHPTAGTRNRRHTLPDDKAQQPLVSLTPCDWVLRKMYQPLLAAVGTELTMPLSYSRINVLSVLTSFQNRFHRSAQQLKFIYFIIIFISLMLW